MPDREKVIKAIKGCINDGSFCNKCDYDGCVFKHGSCEKDLLADALALLNEQEKRWLLLDKNGKITPLPVFVRCKDCKYRSFYCTEATDGTTLYECHHPCANSVPRPSDWFCADGKGRSEKMKKQIIISQDDIQQIIANAFDVDTDKVDLKPYMDLEGYGLGEHYVAKVKATIEVPMNDQR